MRYSDKHLELFQLPRYQAAFQLLQGFKERKVPDSGTFKDLYGSSIAKSLKRSLQSMFNNENYQFIVGKIRNHDMNAPQILAKTRKKVEEIRGYKKIDEKIVMWEIPDEKLFKNIYNINPEFIYSIFSQIIMDKENRDCGISNAAHWNRVGGVSKLLGFSPEKGASHDFLEDLLINTYGPAGYQQCIDLRIPLSYQSFLKKLTNHYDMMIKSIKSDEKSMGRSLRKSNLMKGLENFAQNNELEPFSDYAGKAIGLLEADLFKEDEDIYRESRSLCYKVLYIQQIVNSSRNQIRDIDAIYKTIDLSDNGHATQDLKKVKEIDNINKCAIFGDKVISQINDDAAIEFARELREDALVKAEYLMIDKLLKTESRRHFLASALLEFIKLKEVFYVN